jgi:Tol biopolymer transport system component
MSVPWTVCIGSLSALFCCANAQVCATSQLTLLPGNTSFDGGSRGPVISPDGRFVAFLSDASNTGPTTVRGQVYLLDRLSGALELITQDPNGAPGVHPDPSYSQYTLALGISSDARFVLFASDMGGLVANDTNTQPAPSIQLLSMNVFLRDRATGVTPDRMPDGTTGSGYSSYATMSSDGRWIAFHTTNGIDPLDTDGLADVYLFDRTSGSTVLVGLTSAGAKPVGGAAVGGISDDGRFVVLSTAASDMVAGDTNGQRDVFVRDLWTGTNELISVAAGGLQGNGLAGGSHISPDGRFVLFGSFASNWPGHTFAVLDLYVRDRLLATTTLASVREDGTPAYGAKQPFAMSADGRYVLWGSSVAGITSTDVNLKDDVFLRDTLAAGTTLVSAQPSGTSSGAFSYSGDLTPDGRTIVFSSKSSVLTTPNIVDFVEDIFVRECTSTVPTVYCIANSTINGCTPTISSIGTPSASLTSGFDVALTSARNQKVGLLFYGHSGPTLAPFFGRWLCVAPPLKRTALQSSGGSAVGDDCTGALHFDFNALIAGGADPALVTGAQIDAQYWARDGGAPFGVYLSNALAFEIQP